MKHSAFYSENQQAVCNRSQRTLPYRNVYTAKNYKSSSGKWLSCILSNNPFKKTTLKQMLSHLAYMVIKLLTREILAITVWAFRGWRHNPPQP